MDAERCIVSDEKPKSETQAEIMDLRGVICGVHYNATRPNPDAMGMYYQMKAMAEECEEVLPELRNCRPHYPIGIYRPVKSDAQSLGLSILFGVVIGFIIGILVGIGVR